MYAHVEGSAAGWWAGVLDPMQSFDHLIIVLLVGLAGGLALRAGRSTWTLPAVFVVGLAASAVVGLVLDRRFDLDVELFVAIVAVTALLFVHPRRTGVVAPVVVLAAGALVGLAHSPDTSAEARPIGYIAGFMFTTGLLLAVGDIVGAAIARSGRRNEAVTSGSRAAADDHTMA